MEISELKMIKNKSSVNISVEEYKRPKFFVEIVKPAGTYKTDDTINIEAFAKSYAGNNINGANVSYQCNKKNNYAFLGIWRLYAKEYGHLQEAALLK